MNISRLMDEADRDEQFEEIQNPEWGCLPIVEMLILLLKGETDD